MRGIFFVITIKPVQIFISVSAFNIKMLTGKDFLLFKATAYCLIAGNVIKFYQALPVSDG